MKNRKIPAMQWYPGDYRRDVSVQACTFESRALWREMLDLMHDGEPYGHLTAGGVSLTPSALARIVGISVGRVKRYLAELEQHRVFSRTDDGIIYSRRMVRDEHLREVRRQAGLKGGNPRLLIPPNNGRGVKQEDKQNSGDLVKQSGNQKPTPAVAVAVASAKRTTTPPPAARERGRLLEQLPADAEPELDALLARIDASQHASWLASLNALLSGMHPLGGGLPNAVPPEIVAAALREFNANGEANLNRFKGYCRDVWRPRDSAPSYSAAPARTTSNDFARIAASIPVEGSSHE